MLFVFFKSKTSVLLRSKSYKYTLNNPNFIIPMKIDPVKDASDINVLTLNSIRNSSVQPTFTIHDGPPYANGKPHVGHALNKILKDITLKYKQSQGYNVCFIPGWDCHGLPIEMKSTCTTESSVAFLRKNASEIATKYIEIQKREFKSWGIDADWDGHYATYHYPYQSKEIKAFITLYKKQLIFRELLPTYWSCSSKTALAEAELEYNDHHKSETVFVKFHLDSSSLPFSDWSNTSLLVWTTTPWTLVANEAVGVSGYIKYLLCCIDDSAERIIIGEFSLERLRQVSRKKIEIVAEITGTQLKNCHYRHPIFHDKICPVLEAPFVTDDKGTGLVHIAPAHGKEDFELMRSHGRYETVFVDNNGEFTEKCGESLRGISVLDSGIGKIIALLGRDVFHQEQLIHSYPYDWRTKQPIIIKLSTQWFVNVTKLSNDALRLYEGVKVSPESMRTAMYQFIKSRPHWCISRQRKWGVPIPVLYHGRDEPLVDEEFIDHISQRVEKEGSDFWWNESVDEIVPKKFFLKWGHASSDLRKSADIFDIWFDSGLSWWCTMSNDSVADLYLEGIDQFRGWFSSSLLMGVALKGRSPFRSIVTHGFTVDGQGRKMSKSLGNVTDPSDVVNKYGVDVLRYWACASGTSHRNSISDPILSRIKSQYSSLRNMFRFIVGNISNVSIPPLDNLMGPNVFQSLLPQDRYILHVLAHDHIMPIKILYDNYQFEAITPLLEELISQVSNFYFTIIKDRLYCDSPSGDSYQSCVTTLALLLCSIIPICRPIVPCLCQEIIDAIITTNIATQDQLTQWPHFVASWTDKDVDHQVAGLLLPLRTCLSSIDLSRHGLTTSNKSNPMSELRVDISVKDAAERYTMQLLNDSSDGWRSNSTICEMLRCAFVRIRDPLMCGPLETQTAVCDGRWAIQLGKQEAETKCARCRRYTKEDQSQDCCARCTAAVSSCVTSARKTQKHVRR